MNLHESKMTELQQRVIEIEASIRQLDEEYADIAGQFGTGDRSALKQAAAIEQKITDLRREKQLNSVAQVRIEQQQKDEQEQAEQQANHQKQIEARQYADAIAAINVELDRLLIQLRAQFERRHSLITQLGRTNVVDTSLVNRLISKSAPTRAACAAGLAKFLSLEVPAPGSLIPLAGVNQILIGVGKSAAPERPRLNGGDKS